MMCGLSAARTVEAPTTKTQARFTSTRLATATNALCRAGRTPGTTRAGTCGTLTAVEWPLFLVWSRACCTPGKYTKNRRTRGLDALLLGFRRSCRCLPGMPARIHCASTARVSARQPPGQVQMQRRQAEGLLAFLIFTDPTFVEVCWRLHPSNCSRSKPQLRSHDIGPFPVAATALGRIQKYATSSDCNKDCSSLGLRPLSLESLHCCRFLILVAERVLIGPPVRQHSLLGLA